MNSILRTLRTESGFTLTGTMMGIAIGTFVTLGLVSGLAYTYKARRTLDTNAEASQFFDRMTFATSRADRCSKLLTDAGARIDLVGTTETDLVMENGTIQAGTEIAPKLFVERLKLVRRTDVVPVDSTTGVGFKRYGATLKVQLRNELDPSNIVIGRERNIPMRVVTDTTGLVQSCAPAVEPVRVCEEFGGLTEVNAPQGEGQACKPQSYCQYAGGYTDAPISEGGYVNTYNPTNPQGCPAGFTAQRAGSVAFMYKCGKTCIRMRYHASYVCARCGPPVGAVTAIDPNMGNDAFNEINDGATQFDNDFTQQQNRINGINP